MNGTPAFIWGANPSCQVMISRPWNTRKYSSLWPISTFRCLTIAYNSFIFWRNRTLHSIPLSFEGISCFHLLLLKHFTFKLTLPYKPSIYQKSVVSKTKGRFRTRRPISIINAFQGMLPYKTSNFDNQCFSKGCFRTRHPISIIKCFWNT